MHFLFPKLLNAHFLQIIKNSARYLVGILSVYRRVCESYVSRTRQVKAKSADY